MLQQTLSERDRSLGERLYKIHEEIRANFPDLCRIAVALYDHETDILKTFAHSTDGISPISFYQAKLSEAHSLQEIAKTNQTRIIDDLTTQESQKAHSTKLLESGYKSSMTMPIIFNDHLYGFLFFNSPKKNFFSDIRCATIKAYAGVISLLVVNEMQTLTTFRGAVQTAREFSRQRDEETGNHLERMSRYAHLIALELAPKYKKADDWVEYIFQFTPLHDVGKVAVPDEILLKPGRLTDDEYDVMKTHVQKGGQIISLMRREFGLDSVNFFDMLNNIVLYHHEALDGSGYPYGLKGDEIPLESRICAVADIFDALTSKRPYKNAWSNGDTMQWLLDNAGERLDTECVQALNKHMDEVRKIQAEFEEDFIG
ncbi:transcriptional regulator [Terasakiella brassicae]|uniref:Transcriptional regulator n=1 Tax=Terasakiella brassicae TaxID=1634917 RepID=A0A917C4C8_9PROT|nr:HD-GYP domain-containing protein [Terasakiella brassicae]GGF70216.1 transcriptional regulator [Terasakiella brassicae]